MKANSKNQSLLVSTVKLLARDYTKFFLSFFGVMTVLYLVGFVIALAGNTFRIGGIEGVFFIACLIAGLVAFRENFIFLAQNQIPRSTMTKAFIIEGFIFGLLTSISVSVFTHVMQLISSAFNGHIPSILDLIPGWAKQTGLLGFGRTLIILFFVYVGVYFAGLALGTINYRLNWVGRIIFWVPFGFIFLNGIIGVLQFHFDSVAPEDLEVISIVLARPFIHALDWLTQSLGHFVIGCTVTVVICIVTGAVVFRGAEVKYSNVK